MSNVELQTDNAGPATSDPFDNPMQVQNGLLDRLTNYSERQREKASPERLEFRSTFNTKVSHVRYRVVGILICNGPVSGAAGDEMTITIGSMVHSFYARLGQQWFLYPIEIDRAQNITVTNATAVGNVDWRVTIFAYPE